MCIRCASAIKHEDAKFMFSELNEQNDLNSFSKKTYVFLLIGISGFWGEETKNIILSKDFIEYGILENKIKEWNYVERNSAVENYYNFIKKLKTIHPKPLDYLYDINTRLFSF